MPITLTGRNTASAIIAAAAVVGARNARCAWLPAAIAKKWLREKYGMTVRGYLCAARPDRSPVRVLGRTSTAIRSSSPTRVSCRSLEEFMDELRKSGDSVGARSTAIATGVPVGWGEPVYDKLDADIAYDMMGINAVKGVEIGAGFAAVAQNGSEHRTK